MPDVAEDLFGTRHPQPPPPLAADGRPLVTRRALAAALKVNPQTITKWHDEGLPIARRGGKGVPALYDESAVRAWRDRREDAASTTSLDEFDPLRARAQKELWQARLAQQQHELRSRELVRAVDIEKVWSAEVAAVKAIVRGAYVTHADRILRAALTDGIKGVERELKALGDEVLQQLADPSRPMLPLESAQASEANAAVGAIQ